MKTRLSEAEAFDVETYIHAAQQHGVDEDPDHEVGDLQDMLRVAFRYLSILDRTAFARHPDVESVLVCGGVLEDFHGE